MNSPKPLLASRGLLRALVLLLLPVVLVSTPNVAQAAVVYGDQVGFTVELDGVAWGPGTGMTCNGSAQWVNSGNVLTGTYVAVAGLKCQPGYDLKNQFSCDSDDCAAMTVAVSGDGCADGDTVTTSGGYPVAGFPGVSVTLPETCSVVQVCLAFDGYANNMPDLTADGCAELPLGFPPDSDSTPGGTCSFGSLLSIHRQSYTSASNGLTYWEYRIRAKVDVGSTWGYRGLRGSATAPQIVVGDDHVMPVGTNTGQPSNYSGVQMRVLASEAQPWGFQVYVKSHGLNDSSPDLTQLTTLPQNAAGGRLGTTVPGNCWWYVGPKIATQGWDDPATGVADPLVGSENPYFTDPLSTTGPVVGEPVDDADVPAPVTDTRDEGCTAGFSLFSPSSWLSAGWCEVVSALSSLWDAVQGVATAIGEVPGLIMDGISGLFSPSSGYLDARVQTTKGKLEDTAPAKWVDAFDDLTPGEVTGCEGIEVAPPMPGDEPGVMFNARLGAACSGGMADAAALFKIAISAALVVGGGLACIRALGSGFGWNPGVGDKGGSA